MKITRAELNRMVTAFGLAWRAADARNDRQFDVKRGSRREAGLTAALHEIGIELEDDK